MRKRWGGLVAVVTPLVIAAAMVGPASAGTGGVSLAVCGSEVFDGLAALTRSGTARGLGTGIRTEKQTEQYSGSTEIGQRTPGKPTAGTIDVYFHVVKRTDGVGSVSATTVQAQIDVLNRTFAGSSYPGGSGYDTGFRFRLAGTDTTVSNAWYAQDTFADEVAMKSALKRGSSDDLNIYTTSGGGYLGWAYYPSITASNKYGVLDGVVIHYGSLPGGYIADYNLGYTATHEVGHFLGLAHTFEKGCLGHGDYVDDTPFMSEPTEGCPSGKDTCTRGSGLDPIHNYMDYSYDSCYTEFTKGQTERAQKQFAHWRLKRS